MICWTVCLPSQRSTISRLGPFRRRARSGMSSVRCCWFFSFKRQPAARSGKLLSSGVILESFMIPLRAGRRPGRPAGIDISKIERVELGPEDVALGTQRGVGQILFCARVRVFHDPGQGELGVLRSLRETTGEIIETAGEPGIVLAKAVHAKGNQLLREKLGEGRSDGFEMRSSRDKFDVGLNGVTCCRQDAGATKSEVPRKPGSFDETQPFFDAAGLGAVAVMIKDTLPPGEAEHGVFATSEDGRVFDGDTTLIVITIESPGLKLAAREPAFVHQQVKWMFVVIALFSDGIKASDELGFREQRLFDDVIYEWGHRLNSIPS